MKFDSRPWKLNVDDLWWNKNRIAVRDSLIKHFKSGGGPAFLTGAKGAGKTTLAIYLAEKLPATMFRLHGDSWEWKENDYKGSPIIIVDEVQKVSLEDRKRIINENKHVLMVSVTQDLAEEGIYKLTHKIEPLTAAEVRSYVNYHGELDSFTKAAIAELHKASRGSTRLVNTLCTACLATEELVIDKDTVVFVAKRKYKLRY